MTKLKNPLLSLSASGTISDSVTFTRHSGHQVAKSKPTPDKKPTLARYNAQWWFAFYSAEFDTLSPSAKQVYAHLASRKSTTARALYIATHLKLDTRLHLRMYLDETPGIYLHDGSSYGNDGIAVYTSVVDGAVGLARAFNGSTSRINLPDLDAGYTVNELTISLKLKLLTHKNWNGVFGDFWDIQGTVAILGYATGLIRFFLSNGTTSTGLNSNIALPLNQWVSLVFRWRGSTTHADIWIDGVKHGSSLAMISSLNSVSRAWYLGWVGGATHLNGYIDDVIVWYSYLEDALIPILAARSYTHD